MALQNSDFNPHFREGSDTEMGNNLHLWGISIHTSAKEVTLSSYDTPIKPRISIHTSAKEVTRWHNHFPISALYFNPHFREGSDDFKWSDTDKDRYFNPHFREGSDLGGQYGCLYIDISIHTSAKEVT